jgi:transcriptional regulator NrdR family protein
MCKKCNYPHSSVVWSRNDDINVISRRRECKRCGERFTTIENFKEAMNDRQYFMEIGK